MVDAVETALAQAAIAAERGADLLEYRIDRLPDAAACVGDLVKRSPRPCIITCRPTWEGGEYEDNEAARRVILAAAIEAQPAYLDLEIAAYRADSAWRQLVDHLGETGLILSSHDFQTRPADLLRKLHAMTEARAGQVVKVAWRARSLRDNIEAFELLSDPPKRMIVLCMGEAGQPSRILAKKFNAMLTFAGLDDASVTAPGQVGVETLKNLYRWDALRSSTRVYGVIGWPVGHSMSPHIMNAGFDRVGHDGVYLPLAIPDDYVHFKATVGAWLDYAALDFRGASVTIPHKHNLLRFVAERGGEIDPLAQRIGAANTLTVRDDGSLHVTNTDCHAALDAVCDALRIGRDDLAGRRVGVIGAGGAARAVVAGFAEYGASVVVYNRTVDKGRELAEAFDGQTGKVVAAPRDNLHKTCCSIIINCTPIGMHPEVDASPIDAANWPDSLEVGSLVFDTIYNPIETKLLSEAKEHGCATLSGIEMFVRQAAAQFTAWTDQPAPVQLFTDVVRTRLAAR